MSNNSILTEQLVREFLTQHDLKGPNFEETPQRVAKLWDRFLYDDANYPNIKTFPTTNSEPVVMKNHIAWGYCPHHLVPVQYCFRIGYIPKGEVVGLSKLARIAEYHVKKLPLQEDLTVAITEDLMELLHPHGAACMIEGVHFCAVIRGIKSGDVKFKTTCFRGEYYHSKEAVEEFLNA